MTVPYRIAEAITRHGPDSPKRQSPGRSGSALLAVADRVEQRLTAARRRRGTTQG
jgi:hypothetical protein